MHGIARYMLLVFAGTMCVILFGCNTVGCNKPFCIFLFYSVSLDLKFILFFIVKWNWIACLIFLLKIGVFLMIFCHFSMLLILRRGTWKLWVLPCWNWSHHIDITFLRTRNLVSDYLVANPPFLLINFLLNLLRVLYPHIIRMSRKCYLLI